MNFFNSENWLWKGFGRLSDYFLLSVMWMVCSVPVITVGSASIALYDTVAHCVRGEEKDMFRRFFGTFRRELPRGMALTALWGGLSLLLNVGYQIISQLAAGNTAWSVFSVVYYVTLLIPLGIMCWLVALESRFTYGFLELNRNGLFFTIAHLPQTLAIVALFVVTLNIVRNFLFFVMFLPAVMVHLQSHFIEKVFVRYTPDEEDEEYEGVEGTEEIE